MVCGCGEGQESSPLRYTTRHRGLRKRAAASVVEMPGNATEQVFDIRKAGAAAQFQDAQQESRWRDGEEQA